MYASNLCNIQCLPYTVDRVCNSAVFLTDFRYNSVSDDPGNRHCALKDLFCHENSSMNHLSISSYIQQVISIVFFLNPCGHRQSILQHTFATSKICYPSVIAPVPLIPGATPPQRLILRSSNLPSLRIDIALKFRLCSSSDIWM